MGGVHHYENPVIHTMKFLAAIMSLFVLIYTLRESANQKIVIAATLFSLLANVLYMFGITGDPDHEEHLEEYTKEEKA